MATISQIKKPCSDSLVLLPLFSSAISAGFPSPADDHLEDCLDLNRYLITYGSLIFREGDQIVRECEYKSQEES